MKSPLICPSILNADFLNLDKELCMLNESKADYVHLDIMDGVFVNNISFGTPVVAAVQHVSRKPLDVHLMVINPEKYIETFAKLGASIISIHIEATSHLHKALQEIKSLNLKAGVAINPHTPVAALKEVLHCVDVVNVMSVNPGFGGQTFIENTYNKLADLKALLALTNTSAQIQVDGGINKANSLAVVKAGADMLVVGNAVFSQTNPKQVIQELKNIPVALP